MFGMPDPLYTPEYVCKGDEVAVIETPKGTIRVHLDADGAPIHVANFCELARAASTTASSSTATCPAS